MAGLMFTAGEITRATEAIGLAWKLFFGWARTAVERELVCPSGDSGQQPDLNQNQHQNA